MPYYMDPLLKRWLRRSPDEPAAKTNLVGLGIVAAVMVFWGVVFHVVTTQIWTLPWRRRGARPDPKGAGDRARRHRAV
ncbi:hypothetical protein [Streptomyces sp. NPDC001970]